ncbi:hypothetical protein MRB53_012405 [Persea americana]|uniref:Uncharacterized protein n=1 Tax=Persea americana TaxID=3435 RepID=A0ACC2LXN5_PERAE|nr:hypothetical protein MRB53_012405 [Persea americana]
MLTTVLVFVETYRCREDRGSEVCGDDKIAKEEQVSVEKSCMLSSRWVSRSFTGPSNISSPCIYVLTTVFIKVRKQRRMTEERLKSSIQAQL